MRNLAPIAHTSRATLGDIVSDRRAALEAWFRNLTSRPAGVVAVPRRSGRFMPRNQRAAETVTATDLAWFRSPLGC